MQQDSQSCWISVISLQSYKNCRSSELMKNIIKLLLCVSLYLALGVQFSRRILIRLSLIQDTDMHTFTHGAPKSCWDTQIHNLHFKTHKIESVDEPTKEFSFYYV